MAEVNTKFIANPSFMIQSVGKQTITVAWRPRYIIDTAEDKDANKPVAEVGHYDGFCDWPVLGSLGMQLIGSEGSRFSPSSVSLQPEISLRGTRKVGSGDPEGAEELSLGGTFFFGLFLGENPIHCTKINVRASEVAALPATLEILTPNTFSGQMDRQIVNILADTNMYQNQASIITLDCDFFISRSSILRVDSSFNLAAAPTLAFDMTFDKYLSLEKAMVENYELLQTSAGLQSAIDSEIATVNAKLPETQFKAPVILSQGTPTMQQMSVIKTWKPLIGGSAAPSIQPTVGKDGTNYL